MGSRFEDIVNILRCSFIFDEMNTAYASYFKDYYPARLTVEVGYDMSDVVKTTVFFSNMDDFVKVKKKGE